MPEVEDGQMMCSSPELFL
ncbi:hypothetical protein A2U01_0101581, partial [Trifolium medium]|nr:hypothetical protein [Trifolium medium]